MDCKTVRVCVYPFRTAERISPRPDHDPRPELQDTVAVIGGIFLRHSPVRLSLSCVDCGGEVREFS